MSNYLPRQQTASSSLNQPYSLVRDNQLRDTLETALHLVLGQGVLSGGVVTLAAPFTVQVSQDSTFFSRGVSYTLAAAQQYSAVQLGTFYLWGRILRSASSPQTDRATEDAYSLDLTTTADGVTGAPSEDYFPLAVLYGSSAGLVLMDQEPDGKFVSPAADDDVTTLGQAFRSLLLYLVQQGMDLPPGCEDQFATALAENG